MSGACLQSLSACLDMAGEEELVVTNEVFAEIESEFIGEIVTHRDKGVGVYLVKGDVLKSPQVNFTYSILYTCMFQFNSIYYIGSI